MNIEQTIITFSSKWDEEKQKYNQESMIEDFLKYIGDNNLFIQQIIRWNEFNITALVYKKQDNAEMSPEQINEIFGEVNGLLS